MKYLNNILLVLSLVAYTGLSATNIGGTVASDVTLTLADSPYNLTSDYTIPDGFTLTIEPGVEIIFDSYSYEMLIAGTLSAVGNAVDSITFTSSASNGGGSVVLQASSNSHSLMYCRFENLGFFSLSAYDTGLYIEDTDLSMDHCSFENCGPSGIRHILANASVLSNIGPSNSLDVVELLPLTLDRTCTWPNMDSDGFIYRMTDDQICPLGETLTIEGGVEIDLINYYSDLQIFGELIANGNASDSIAFTSSGSNNGGSVVLLDGSIAEISYARFTELGTFSLSLFDTGLYIEESDVTLDHCSYSECGSGGVRSITADASAVSNFGPNNDLDRIRLLSLTLDKTCTWPKADPSGVTYELPGDQNVMAGDSLTISAGVEIELLEYHIDILVQGALNAHGTETDPIRIYNSSSNGGGSLVLDTASVADLEYMNFDSLGTFSLSAYDTGLEIRDASVTADHLTFTHCGSGGTDHIKCSPDALAAFGPDNSVQDVLFIGSNVAQDAVWPLIDPTGVNYLISSDITVDAGMTLTLEPGVDVELTNYYVDLLIDGTLLAVGTEQDSIGFTGPAANGGGSIVFNAGSTNNLMKYCSLSKLGSFGLSSKDAGVYTESLDLTVEKSKIIASKTGIVVEAGLPVIKNNIIKDNTVLGLSNDPGNGLVTACDNYWGDPSGPYNATSNPTGTGNGVSDNVLAGTCFSGPLEIICPSDVTLSVGDDYSTGAIGNIEICIQDCPALASYSFSDDILDPQCTEDMTRTFTLTDTCGNVQGCVQTVSFIDEINPSITCPPNEVLDCNEPVPAADLGEVVATDNCEVASVILANQQETVDGCIHTYARRFRVTDTSGNTARCTQTFTVKEDQNPPVLVGVPSDVTVECEAPAIATVTATDDCDDVNVLFSETGSAGCGSTIIRTWSATDGCGNSAVASQTITFNDTTAPVLSGVPSDVTVECDAPSVAMVTATDNCDGSVDVVFNETGAPGCGSTIVRTWTATDDCGNSTVGTQTITFDDTTAPILDPAPADLELACDDTVPAAATLTASDNCGTALVEFSEDVVGACPTTITRTWTATDDCGNSTVETQVITLSPESTCDLNNICTDMDVVEIGFGTANARVNATWTNPNGTTDCEVRGGRIAPGSIGTGSPQFANINNTQVITQTDGSTVLFNIVLYNNPNVPFNVGQTYGYEVRCLCEDETAYTNWSGIIPDATFVVPSPPPAPSVDSSSDEKLNTTSVLSVFPNPNNGEEINLSMSGSELDNPMIRILDMNGKLIYESRVVKDIKSDKMNVRFDTGLERGVYLVQVFNDNQLINQRFIVE